MTADYSLYLATDPILLGQRDLCNVVAEAVDAGVTVVQLRDKTAGGADLYRTACRLLEVTRPRGVPLIVNDRVDVALAARADGVHVGVDDLPLEQVRRLVGPDSIVGYSVNTDRDLDVAAAFGADYIGVGPLFPTATKPDARTVLGVDGLRRLAARATCPVVAIGGITSANCADAISCGAAGICVISAILGQADISAAVTGFRSALSRR
jgi:thiamine-phosphate pyrophosphorylase